MPEWIKVIILGVVEGLTEFLPVSSTGHLLLTSEALQLEPALRGTLEVSIQFGAVVALLVFYGRDLLTQVRTFPSDPGVRQFWLSIVVAFVPAAILGLILRSWIKEHLFTSPSVIAWALIAGGIIFLLVDWRATSQPRRSADRPEVSLRQAVVIGLAQATALVPGVSRSGASIFGGLFVGLDRTSATAFSFYLAIPTLGAATLVDLAGSVGHLSSGDLALVVLGMVVSAIVSGLTMRWLLGYIAHHTFVPFGIYRIALGVFVLLLTWLHVL